MPLVVVLHALTFRWRSISASSLVFWTEVIREHRAGLRIRRVLRSLVLLLQVLAMAALAFALGGPLILDQEQVSQDVILVLDATGSMQAREGARTRWDLARDRGLALASRPARRGAHGGGACGEVPPIAFPVRRGQERVAPAHRFRARHR